jgi:putative CocE/NonD family hydrolase
MRRQLYTLAVASLVGLGVVQWQSTQLAGQATRPAESRPVQHYDEAVLSKPTYEVRTEVDVKIPMRDGALLSADIYRPDAEGRFPAVLVRTPYSNGTDANIATSKWWAQRGYVLIQQDVRGKYDSKGDFYPFKNEPNDGYDMDEWIGKQPWFNGKLGTMGGSYVGFTQWGQAIRGSKYLVAMAPQVTTPDIYGNWLYIDGALNYAFDVSWGSVSIDGQIAQATSGIVDMMKVYRTLPIIDAPKTAGHRAPHYRDWVMHPTRDDPYWNDISFENDHDKVEVPMLTIEGWYDIFVRGAINDDIAIRAKAKTEVARTGKRLMIGPWVHGTGRRNNTPANAASDPNAVDFGPAAETDNQKITLRWFDYWLKGIQNGVREEPPIKIFVMGENVWRHENEWPLTRAQPTKFYISSGGRANTLHGDGVLSTAMPKGADTDTYTYDPDNPVPTLGGNSCCAALTPTGPWDQRAAERRDDVLVFSTPPLKEAVEVTGPVTMKLYAATSARDTDWTAKLVDVRPDGFARNVQEGILRARYRETRGQRPGTLLEPGRVYEYTIDMWAGSNLFLPGHQIRLEISSSNFPRFDRNLNTGENTATGTRMEKARQTIYHNTQYPSHVVLPIVPRGAQPPAAPSSASVR